MGDSRRESLPALEKEEFSLVEVHELVKRYGNHLAVDHLSFTVSPGQVYGFLGPNGAGKSTTMNLMTGYLGPTSGQVLVDGISVVDQPELAKGSIGYLPELPPLYPDMTVEEYLLFCAGLKKVPRGERESQVDRVLEMTDTGEVAPRLIAHLSKGYKQRVGLAQALLGFPKLLILDEPTVGLDPKQILEMRTLIRQLAREHTVLLSSHILSEVQEVCDQVLIINHGKKVADGTPAQLTGLIQGAAALLVTLKGTEEGARQLLEGVANIGRVIPLAGEEGLASFRLEPPAGADPREGIFRACAGAGMPLLDMHYDGVNLEDVFLRLTDDQAPEEAEEASHGTAKEEKTR